MRFGVTFSEPYARALGLVPEDVLRGLVGDIGLRLLRLCVYWDGTEPQPGEFDFRSPDWQVTEATEAGADIVLAVGQKAPRWPEYHRPPWLAADDPLFEYRLLRLIETAVRRYAEARISIWQLENEPFVPFGGPRIKEDLLRLQIELVRSLDTRPVMLTDSADKGNWRRTAKLCDVLGVNLYTRVWDGRRHRYVDIGLSASDYAKKISTVASPGTPVIVSELQAEPWGPGPVAELTPAEASVTMNPERLRQNVDLARHAGFETVLLWGGEWWYWLRERGDPSMWNTARSIAEELS